MKTRAPKKEKEKKRKERKKEKEKKEEWKKSISKVETQDYIKGKNKKYMGQTDRDNLIVVSSAPLAGQVFF